MVIRCITMSENVVKFELEVPEKLWEAFAWYTEKTPNYFGHEHANISYNQVIIRAIRDYLDAELNSGCPEAREVIYEELKQRLQ